jgi:hypothetical protein
MRVLPMLAFAIVLATGAYAQQPGYQQQPGSYTQQLGQGGIRWTCSQCGVPKEQGDADLTSQGRCGLSNSVSLLHVYGQLGRQQEIVRECRAGVNAPAP